MEDVRVLLMGYSTGYRTMLSIVIPVFDEAESLMALYRELSEVAQSNSLELDIIFVDDGSTDGSWECIQKLATQETCVRGIRLRRNFGKTAAISAGFDAARGKYIFTLDADLQDDPREIPHFLSMMERGYDVVSGWKKVRHDPWHKVFPSRVFNVLVSWMTKVHLHDHNCGFKCYRREIFDEIRLYGELHRFIPVLAAARGFRIGEVVVHHRQRRYGHSKYGVHRFVKGLIDLLTVTFLTGYGQRPQHVLGAIGLFCFLSGLLGLFYITFMWILSRLDNIGLLTISLVKDYHIFSHAIDYYTVIALLLGAQFLIFGLLASLFTANSQRGEHTYAICDRTDMKR